MLIGNVLKATNKIISEQSKCRIGRERHGPQAIASTSGSTINLTQHVHPKDQLAFTPCIFLRLAQGFMPINIVGELVNPLRTDRSLQHPLCSSRPGCCQGKPANCQRR